LQFLPSSPSGWLPRALTCSAKTGHGVANLWACVLEYAACTKTSGWFEHRRQDQARRSMRENLEVGLIQLFRSDPIVQKRLMELEKQVLARQITADGAVRDLLGLFASKARARS
jgi:LAO/AO transport system kinase